jgi:hypothetical protein
MINAAGILKVGVCTTNGLVALRGSRNGRGGNNTDAISISK